MKILIEVDTADNLSLQHAIDTLMDFQTLKKAVKVKEISLELFEFNRGSTGEPTGDYSFSDDERVRCKIVDCEGRVFSKGQCKYHYQKAYRMKRRLKS